MSTQKKPTFIPVLLALLALGLASMLIVSYRHTNTLENKIHELESQLSQQAQTQQPQQVAGPGVASSPSDRMIKDLSTRFVGDPRSISEKLRDFLNENADFQHMAIACKVIAEMTENQEALSNQELNWLYQQVTELDVKRVVAQVLSQRGDNALIDSYIAQYRAGLSSNNPEDLQKSLGELAKTRYAGAANFIVPHLDAKDPSLLQNVMLALKTTGNESHIAKLKPLLNHPDPSVSWLAKDTLDSLETLSKKARTRLNKADILAELPSIMEQ